MVHGRGSRALSRGEWRFVICLATTGAAMLYAGCAVPAPPPISSGMVGMRDLEAGEVSVGVRGMVGGLHIQVSNIGGGGSLHADCAADTPTETWQEAG